MNLKPAEILCPACGEAHLQPFIGEYSVRTEDGLETVLEQLPQLRCPSCCDVSLPATSAREVDKALAELAEQLTSAELIRIRQKLEVDQTAMSEAMGLGAKSYHRWEKGTQMPSRSMGYYIRVLSEFPEAFRWLRDRGWQKRGSVIHCDFRSAFPAIADQAADFQGRSARINPARALFERAI